MATNNHDKAELEQKFAARQQDKATTSGQIGATTRFIAFGLVALVFTLYGSDSSIAGGIRQSHEWLLHAVALLACAAILSDYLQYFCGYLSVNNALQREEAAYKYDSDKLAYIWRVRFFWAKQVFAFSGAIMIVIAIAIQVFSPAGTTPNG